MRGKAKPTSTTLAPRSRPATRSCCTACGRHATDTRATVRPSVRPSICLSVCPVSTAVLFGQERLVNQEVSNLLWQRATTVLVGGLRRSAHGRFEPLRFLYRFDGAFCWKRKRSYQRSGCFTVVFSQTQLLRFLGAAAAAARQLPVAARLETHLLGHTSGVRTVRHLSSSVCRWKFVWLFEPA